MPIDFVHFEVACEILLSTTWPTRPTSQPRRPMQRNPPGAPSRFRNTGAKVIVANRLESAAALKSVLRMDSAESIVAGDTQESTLERLAMRLDGFEMYAFLSSLIAGFSYGALSELGGAVSNAEENLPALLARPFSLLFALTLVASIFSGLYATCVFALCSLYSKTALAENKDSRMTAFLQRTARYRTRGFRYFITSLITFAFSVLQLAVMRLDPRVSTPTVALGAMFLYSCMRDVRALLLSAAPIFTPSAAPIFTPDDERHRLYSQSDGVAGSASTLASSSAPISGQELASARPFPVRLGAASSTSSPPPPPVPPCSTRDSTTPMVGDDKLELPLVENRASALVGVLSHSMFDHVAACSPEAAQERGSHVKYHAACDESRRDESRHDLREEHSNASLAAVPPCQLLSPPPSVPPYSSHAALEHVEAAQVVSRVVAMAAAEAATEAGAEAAAVEVTVGASSCRHHRATTSRKLSPMFEAAVKEEEEELSETSSEMEADADADDGGAAKSDDQPDGSIAGTNADGGRAVISAVPPDHVAESVVVQAALAQAALAIGQARAAEAAAVVAHKTARAASTAQASAEAKAATWQQAEAVARQAAQAEAEARANEQAKSVAEMQQAVREAATRAAAAARAEAETQAAAELMTIKAEMRESAAAHARADLETRHVRSQIELLLDQKARTASLAVAVAVAGRDAVALAKNFEPPSRQRLDASPAAAFADQVTAGTMASMAPVAANTMTSKARAAIKEVDEVLNRIEDLEAKRQSTSFPLRRRGPTSPWHSGYSGCAGLTDEEEAELRQLKSRVPALRANAEQQLNKQQLEERRVCEVVDEGHRFNAAKPAATATPPLEVAPAVAAEAGKAPLRATPSDMRVFAPELSSPVATLPPLVEPVVAPAAAMPAAVAPSAEASAPAAVAPAAVAPAAVAPAAVAPAAVAPAAVTPMAATPMAVTPTAVTPMAVTPRRKSPSSRHVESRPVDTGQADAGSTGFSGRPRPLLHRPRMESEAPTPRRSSPLARHSYEEAPRAPSAKLSPTAALMVPAVPPGIIIAPRRLSRDPEEDPRLAPEPTTEPTTKSVKEPALSAGAAAYAHRASSPRHSRASVEVQELLKMGTGSKADSSRAESRAAFEWGSLPASPSLTSTLPGGGSTSVPRAISRPSSRRAPADALPASTAWEGATAPPASRRAAAPPLIHPKPSSSPLGSLPTASANAKVSDATTAAVLPALDRAFGSPNDDSASWSPLHPSPNVGVDPSSMNKAQRGGSSPGVAIREPVKASGRGGAAVRPNRMAVHTGSRRLLAANSPKDKGARLRALAASFPPPMCDAI